MTGFPTRRIAFVAGALAALAPACAGAENMHANYRVSLIGLPIGVAVADGAVADNHYKVDLHVRLTGLAALVSNLRMALVSSGAYQGGAILATPPSPPIPRRRAPCAWR
jgi:hypothetical protein